MGTNKLQENKLYFMRIKGIGSVVELLNTQPICVRVIEAAEPVLKGTTFVLECTRQLETLVTEKFKIGDSVKSVSMGNPFTVTSYEIYDNKVVVKSETNHDDRKRYAYKHDELVVVKPGVYIKIGKQYKVNNSITCIATIHPGFTERFLLVQIDGTNVGGFFDLEGELNKETETEYIVTRPQLARHAIHNIQLIK